MANTQKTKHKSRIRQRKSRRQIGSRMYKNYSVEMLEIACEAVESKKITSRDAERQFGIPRRTIMNKIKKVHTNSVGHPTVLTAEEEKKILRVLQVAAEYGSPLTKMDLKLLVHENMKKNSQDDKFKNKIPGDAWVQAFLARHSDELTVRTTQNISKARAEKGPQEIAEYFDNLTTTLKDIPAENIINLDETNLSDNPGSSKCIFRRGVKYPERVVNSTKGNISLMFTATASGKCLPLYVVYKAANLYSEWISGGPRGTRYNCTKSGWFDSAMFEDYFEKIILPWAQETLGTKVVICDNLSSHLSVKVVEICEQNNINLVFIPPRSTHLTQPLDVAFFAPLKKAWRKILYEYKLKNPNQASLNKKHFPKLLSELIEAIELKEAKNIKSGFKASGILQMHPREVLKKIPDMQEEILSYGIDQTLIDYLKETRAAKPMQIKKNKKIKCEPGKSVTVSDLNIESCKDALETNNKTKIKSRKKSSGVAKVNKKSKVTLFLDEQTGMFIKTVPNDDTMAEENEGCYLDGNFSDSDNQNTFNPESLNKICIKLINFHLVQSKLKVTTSSTSAQNSSRLKASSGNGVIYTKIKEQRSLKNYPSKITILSNVVIKPATQTSDVCTLNDISNNIKIMSFNSELPDCLQENKIKVLEKENKENSRKRKKVNRKDKSSAKKPVRSSASVKRRKNRLFSESSSLSTDTEVITIDTDNSDYETVHDYYIAECLREQEEKENFELDSIKFGLHDIQYCTENQKILKESDWILARFSTKKSIKHFVGQVLDDNDSNPTVKFVRKVKQSRCDKGTTFTYPIIDDICTIQHLEDVITKLPEPDITRRGHIIFYFDFSSYNIQ